MIKCRACLKDEGSMVPFSDQHINYFNLLTNIQVQLCDKLPHHLCLCCYETLKSFIEFREKCIVSNNLLLDSSESKHKIEIDVIESDRSDVIKSENFKNESPKMELNIDNIDEIFEDDLIDENNYHLLDDLIKIENIEEQVKTSKRKRVTKIDSKRQKTSKNILCELKTTSEKKPKSSKNTVTLNSKDSVLLCGLCTQTFEETSHLTSHLCSHKTGTSASTSSTCGLCSEVFSDWPALFSHRLIHLTNKQKKCHICFKKFYKPLHMEYHYRKFHTDDKDYVIKCSECSRTFTNPRTLQKHVWSKHSDKTFICEHCAKVFKSKNSIRTHMPVHNTEHHLVCDLCDYTCRFSSNLKDHKLRKHTPKKTYCKKCTRVFSNQEKLDSHNCGEKCTICPTCGKVGKTHRQLLRHLASHEATPRYKCGRCPKQYRSRSSLVTHGLRHDGVRPRHCEYCSANFYSLPVLIKHRRTHTGEKPYVCQVCCKGFTGNHNLKVHMRVHGEYLIEKKKTDVTIENK